MLVIAIGVETLIHGWENGTRAVRGAKLHAAKCVLEIQFMTAASEHASV